MCLGLSQIHKKKLIHRDIKLENVLIKGADVGGIALISDFGSIKSQMSTLLSVAGTSRYFAPEVATLDFDCKVDVWAAGIMLYELLTFREFPLKVAVEFDGDKVIHTVVLKPWPEKMSGEVRLLIEQML